MTKPPALTFPDLFTPHTAHGFFGRQGGVSEGLFESLNVTLYSGDDIEAVRENRKRVMEALGGESLLTLKQTHSPCCLTPFEAGAAENFPEGDALVTDQPNIVLGVMTADCAPILLEGKKKDGSPVIAATHAGWGGALKGICEATVIRMVELGAELPSIRAAIGPCIGFESYEVGEDFAKPFLMENAENIKFFKNKNTKLYFNLEGYVAYRLIRGGVGHPVASGRDTYSDERHYFSFRRSTHRSENQYGRQLSAITIIKT